MAPIGNNNRHVLGGANKRNNIISSAVSSVEPKVKKLTLDDFFIVADVYDFPRQGEVPAGYFISEVKDIQIRHKRDGTPLLDVHYEIEGYDYKNSGQVFHIKQSYVPESEHWKAFCKAMVKAGVKEKSNVMSSVGVTERIRLEYVSDTSDFGSIVDRAPYKKGNAVAHTPHGGAVFSDTNEDDDSEFDDYLPDEDDD